jgi:Ran GTPase-activating protein (RanGAP) involved in mRNA processing and transport
MRTEWAQRREEILNDCIVSPDVFHQMVDRLAKFVVPYQHVLKTKAGQRNMYSSPRKVRGGMHYQ